MNVEAMLLGALHDDPADAMAWLALADWLEEQGQPQRAELLRLRQTLLRPPCQVGRPEEERLRGLLAEGVRPCVPEVVNSIGMRLALIPPGSFLMGSADDEDTRFEDEGPVHEVAITRPFYLGVFPVTQKEYERVTGVCHGFFVATGERRSAVKGLDTASFPVEGLTWRAAASFCRALSELPAEKEAGRVYRLPTEAEWEYACRAGTTTTFHFGPSLSSREANFDGSNPYGDGFEEGPDLERTTAVGEYPPNAFGLFDVHGNVSEWVADWFEHDYYATSPRQDPQGPREGSRCILRGGAWRDEGMFCRAAFRYDVDPETANDDCGVRVVMTIK
jgi:uncharacterized protein (TIGR02996 family)